MGTALLASSVVGRSVCGHGTITTSVFGTRASLPLLLDCRRTRVIDGEIVALDEHGKPSFNVLQNYGTGRAPVLYYVFDVIVLAGKGSLRRADARPCQLRAVLAS